MLLGIGPGVQNLQSYSNNFSYDSVTIQSTQGTTLDQLQVRVFDLLSSFPIVAEDDIVCLDELDPAGWPTVNLFNNPSFEGTYSGGVAPSWAPNNNVTGFTPSKHTGTFKFGSACQKFIVSNVANATTGMGIFQSVPLPVDEKQNALIALPYVVSIYSQVVTSAAVGLQANLNIEWYNAANTRLRTDSVSIPMGAPQVNIWTRTSLQVTPPATAVRATPTIYLNSTSGTNSVTLLLDGAQFEYATFANYLLPGDITALASGKYPTPYCDPSQPGCYTDTGLSGLYYRQLRLFGGLIRHTHNEYPGGPERFWDIQAVDYGVLFQEAPANLIIASQADNAAISAAAVYATNQGFLAGIDYTTYVSNIATISNLVFSWQTTADVMNQIANQTVAAWWVDYYRFLHYVPALANTTPFNLSGTPDGVSTFPFTSLIIENDSTESRSSPVIEGSTQLSSPVSETQTGTGAKTVFTVNTGNAIAQVDSLTVGGVSKTIGLASVNTFAQGYDALLDPNAATITFNVAPGNAVSVVFIYRYAAPVLVRLHWPPAESPTGSLRRKVHHHTKEPRITSQQAAIDRANADLAQYQKARPIGTLTVWSPPWPTAVPIRPGTAIAITFAPAGLNQQLYQIQEVDTHVWGNGKISRDLSIGFYRPDLAIMMANAQRAYSSVSNTSGSSVLQDVLTLSDGWSITDSVQAVVSNLGAWGNPTSTVWGTTSVWG